ncbi:RNA-directed DNA polymerase from mobile element jockey [Elysia marginata]|uniref:RNA-directed DNA polymerase from mobile element jockey n=1 Tax=Elysia marginata TaxID=1093978 RepID=A0AAV4EPA5_9GAST|nr:RNA-directed DNA polymerase from mobile element jockey [Elysia marginata]
MREGTNRKRKTRKHQNPNLILNLEILSWNCWSLKDKKEELKNIIDTEDQPALICLQETKLKVNRKLNIPNYKEHRLSMDDKSIGLSILVRKDINFVPTRDHTGKRTSYQTIEIFTKKSQILPHQHIPPTLEWNRETRIRRNAKFRKSCPGRRLQRQISNMGGTKQRQIRRTTSTHNPRHILHDNQHRRSHKDTTASQAKTISNRPYNSFNFQYEAIQWKILEDSLGSDHFPCKTTLIGNGGGGGHR